MPLIASSEKARKEESMKAAAPNKHIVAQKCRRRKSRHLVNLRNFFRLSSVRRNFLAECEPVFSPWGEAAKNV